MQKMSHQVITRGCELAQQKGVLQLVSVWILIAIFTTARSVGSVQPS